MKLSQFFSFWIVVIRLRGALDLACFIVFKSLLLWKPSIACYFCFKRGFQTIILDKEWRLLSFSWVMKNAL